MKFTCNKAFTTHIVCWEGHREITFNNYDISEMDISELQGGLKQIPKSVHTLIIPSKTFFDFAVQCVYLRMADIFKMLPDHVTTVKIDVSVINKLTLVAQKAIMSIRGDLNIIGVDFQKYGIHYPSVLIRRDDEKKMAPGKVVVPSKKPAPTLTATSAAQPAVTAPPNAIKLTNYPTKFFVKVLIPSGAGLLASPSTPLTQKGL